MGRGFAFILLAAGLSGCRGPARLAWAADARGLSPLAGPVWAAPRGEAARAQQSLGLYLSGLLLEFSGDFSGARSKYDEAIRQDPENAEILIRQGILCLRTHEIVQAEQAFRAAGAAAPADLRPRFLLGVLFTNQERFEEAVQQYAQVLIRDPENLGALSQLAQLYLQQDKLQEGLDVHERLLQQKPDSAVLHFNIGVLYAKAERWPDAVEHLAQAVANDPGHLEARLGLAVSLELAGQVERARAEFQQALDLEPANTQLIYYLARISQRLGDLEQSAGWLTRYLSFKPYEAQAHLELAYVRIQQSRWQEALDQIQGVLNSSHPEQSDSQLWTLIGSAYETGGQEKAAEEAYRKALSAGTEEVDPYLRLGSLYQRRGEFQRAEEMFQQAFEKEPDRPEVLNALGYLYADWGVHLEEAVRLIERALAGDPQNGGYLDSLGWAYFKAGQTQQALGLLEEAVSLTTDSEIFEHLGQVYSTLGRDGQAEKIWKRALSLKPQDPTITQRLKSHLKALQRKRKD